jgi:hypothetical protein
VSLLLLPPRAAYTVKVITVALQKHTAAAVAAAAAPPCRLPPRVLHAFKPTAAAPAPALPTGRLCHILLLLLALGRAAVPCSSPPPQQNLVHLCNPLPLTLCVLPPPLPHTHIHLYTPPPPLSVSPAPVSPL